MWRIFILRCRVLLTVVERLLCNTPERVRSLNFNYRYSTKHRTYMSADVLAKVQAVIADKLEVDAGKITPEANFTDDLGADSLDVVELVMALEEEFDVEIPDEEAEKLQTVQSVVDYIKAKSA